MRSARLLSMVVGLAVVGGAVAVLVAKVHTAEGDTTGVNVALGRPYRLAPAPNYQWALGKRGTELTDGEAARGTFWTNGQSVGWSWHSPVTVTVDLGAAQTIDRVRVQTGANTTVGIRYPAQILVFGGNGAGRFDLLASSALSRDADDPATPRTRFIDFRFAARKMRQLVVVAFARNSLMYLSEIEAFAAEAGGADLAGILHSPQEVHAAALRERRAAIERLPDPKPVGPSMAQRWAMPLAGAEPAGEGCEVQPVDPWEPERAAVTRNANGVPTLALIGLVGGYSHAAWRIVNRGDQDVRVDVTAKAPASLEVRTHVLAYAQALNYAWIPDVVEPLQGAVTLPARSALLVLAEARAATAGAHAAEIAIACGAATFPATVRLNALPEDADVAPLHGNLWSYLHERPHAPIAKALACAPDFHERYGVDFVVVHPEALLDGGRGRPTTLLQHYFRAYKGAKRVLLFMDVKSRPWAFWRMDKERGADALRQWWAWVDKVAEEEGVTGELLLYPVDEPSLNDVPRLESFRDLVTRAGLKARLYATIDSREVAARLTWLDVMQLVNPEANRPTGAKAQLELYAAVPEGRLMPMERYYRGQGWAAYQLGMTGVGVWASWDGTGIADPASGWNPFGVDDRDFSLIYASPNGCAWPSRRLLAWRRGIEENRILRQCARRMPRGEVDKAVAAVAKPGGKSMTQALAEIVTACGFAASGPPG